MANRVPINPCKADVFKNSWLEDQQKIIYWEQRVEMLEELFRKRKIWDDEIKNIDYK